MTDMVDVSELKILHSGKDVVENPYILGSPQVICSQRRVEKGQCLEKIASAEFYDEEIRDAQLQAALQKVNYPSKPFVPPPDALVLSPVTIDVKTDVSGQKIVRYLQAAQVISDKVYGSVLIDDAKPFSYERKGDFLFGYSYDFGKENIGISNVIGSVAVIRKDVELSTSEANQAQASSGDIHEDYIARAIFDRHFKKELDKVAKKLPKQVDVDGVILSPITALVRGSALYLRKGTALLGGPSLSEAYELTLDHSNHGEYLLAATFLGCRDSNR
jgi:hypothetical protein